MLILTEGIAFWENLSTQIERKDQTLSMLFFTAVSAELFISDFDFLADLNKFIGFNDYFLWKTDP